MLGNYDLLLESSQELQEFLVFIYENETVIADIDIPFEWKSLIDESYDEDGNQYYSLTNRAQLLLNEISSEYIQKAAQNSLPSREAKAAAPDAKTGGKFDKAVYAAGFGNKILPGSSDKSTHEDRAKYAQKIASGNFNKKTQKVGGIMGMGGKSISSPKFQNKGVSQDTILNKRLS